MIRCHFDGFRTVQNRVESSLIKFSFIAFFILCNFNLKGQNIIEIMYLTSSGNSRDLKQSQTNYIPQNLLIWQQKYAFKE
jgi:hypothetical protein